MYYIYAHVHPITEELLYVGKGTDARAWSIKDRGCGHHEILEALIEDYGRGSYVRIVADDLEEDNALSIEKGLIALNQPSMNTRRLDMRGYDDLDYREAIEATQLLWSKLETG